MRTLVIELGQFVRSMLLRWINLVGGAAIAFLQMVYRGKEPDWSAPAILITCFIVASFLAWRDEHRKSVTKDRRSTLYKIRDLIHSTAKDHPDKKYDSFGALVKHSDELSSEEDVLWVCDALEAGGHEAPFNTFDEIAGPAFRGHKLSFLQEARASSLEIKRITSAISFAVKGWSRKDIYIKEHRAYRGYTDANSPSPNE
jgi:hypothetical protein